MVCAAVCTSQGSPVGGINVAVLEVCLQGVLEAFPLATTGFPSMTMQGSPSLTLKSVALTK